MYIKQGNFVTARVGALHVSNSTDEMSKTHHSSNGITVGKLNEKTQGEFILLLP